MEVKPGYKQTEAGVIPDDWEAKTLGNFVSLQRGHDLTERNRRRGDVPVMGSAGQNGFHDTSLAKGPGVVLGRSGASFGQAHYCEKDYWPHNTALYVTDFRGNVPLYTFYLLKSLDFTRYNSGGAQQSLNRNFISPIAVGVPPLPEQRAIVEALRNVDALLLALTQLIAKKRDLKQGAMQQLLSGQHRLPGCHGEWKVKRLAEIGDISSAGVDKKSRHGEVPVRLVNYLDVYQRDFIFSDGLNHWVTAPSHQAKRCAVQKGDVFFTPSSETRDDIGISAVAMEHISDAAYSYHVVRLRLREEMDLGFRAYAFKTRAFLDQAEMLCDGNGTRYVISQGKFRSMTVKVPPVPEQTAIASVLSDMDAEISALEARRDKTRAVKQGMMQELLTGRTRLVSSEAPSRPQKEKRAVANPSSHNWEINEAVVISVLAKQFGTATFPLGRKRYTKLTYLLHRHVEKKPEGYLKKAAGPYNPRTKYKGPEGIAQRNGYIRMHANGQYSGFVAADNIGKAEEYFQQWYGPEALQWLEQFRFRTNDQLELLATVDMAVRDLQETREEISLQRVKDVIRSHPEWEAKLTRPVFADANLTAAMKTCEELFD